MITFCTKIMLAMCAFGCITVSANDGHQPDNGQAHNDGQAAIPRATRRRLLGSLEEEAHRNPPLNDRPGTSSKPGSSSVGNTQAQR